MPQHSGTCALAHAPVGKGTPPIDAATSSRRDIFLLVPNCFDYPVGGLIEQIQWPLAVKEAVRAGKPRCDIPNAKALAKDADDLFHSRIRKAAL